MRESKRLIQEFRLRGSGKVKSSAQPRPEREAGGGEAPPGPSLQSCDSLLSCDLEQVSVKEAGLRSGSVLLLEEGPPPVAGLLCYPLYLWAGADPSSPNGTTALEPQGGHGEQQEALFKQALDHRRKNLVRLGGVLCHEDMKPSSLRRLVSTTYKQIAEGTSMRLPASVTEVLSARPDDFLLRELRGDLLPGRTVVYAETSEAEQTKKPRVNAPLTAALLGSIGRKDPGGGGKGDSAGAKGKGKGANTRRGGNSIPSLGILEPDLGGALVIYTQPAPAPEAPEEGQQGQAAQYCELPGTTRLWLQVLPVPEPAPSPGQGEVASDEGVLTVPMQWPPREVVFRGASKPSIGQLYEHLASSLAPADQGQDQHQDQPGNRGLLRVFKWYPLRGEWTELCPDPSLANLPTAEDKDSGGAAKKSSSWSLTFTSTKQTQCRSSTEAEALMKTQETARRKLMKAPVTVAPIKLAEGDLLAAFFDPGLPVRPLLASASDSSSSQQRPAKRVVCKGIRRPEDAYTALLLSRAEAQKMGVKAGAAGSYLTSAELSSARAIAAKNAALSKQSGAGAGAGDKKKPEAVLRLNLDFSDDEDEDEDEEGDSSEPRTD